MIDLAMTKAALIHLQGFADDATRTIRALRAEVSGLTGEVEFLRKKIRFMDEVGVEQQNRIEELWARNAELQQRADVFGREIHRLRMPYIRTTKWGG